MSQYFNNACVTSIETYCRLMTYNNKHIAIAGDSIFDNDGYVPNDPGVIEQLRTSIPSQWSAMKIAVDGDCIRHVYSRVENFPDFITDLVLSIGGNDALGYASILNQAKSLSDIPSLVAKPASEFRANYKALLSHLLTLNTNLHVCTIYTAVPFEDPLWRQFVPPALNMFNSIIKEEAALHDIGVIEIDKVCTEEEDYSKASPIEPSAIGGQKIVDAIIRHLEVQS